MPKEDSKEKLFFGVIAAVVICSAFTTIVFLETGSELNILPEIFSTRTHEAPKRNPLVFAEDYSDSASVGKISFLGDTAFSFNYTRSIHKNKPFTGALYPLENLKIDFSRYDVLSVRVKANEARRIPVNLSVQNKKETHQYIRHFIEIKKGQQVYDLPLDEFDTPEGWYTRNNVSQAEIPKQDLSKVEAISFENCQLIKPGVEDEYTITALILKKELGLVHASIVIFGLLVLGGSYVLLFKPFGKETQVVHVPIESVEITPEADLGEQVLVFLGKNYTNPNLTLNDLGSEFGRSTVDVSKAVKEKTKFTFPKYLSFLRVEEAKRVLKSGEFKTVSEIGYTVGFNSPSNFIRVFKSLEGVSPKKYHDQLSKEEG